jgi:hypothetical protein
MLTIVDLEEMLEEHLPGMRITALKSGEIVIYTGLKENDEEELIPLDSEEVDGEDTEFGDDVESYEEDDEED